MARRKKPDAATDAIVVVAASPGADSDKKTSAQKIEEFGFERILDLIEDGETQRDIAGMIGVDRRQFRTWIDRDEDRRRLVQAAIEESAAHDDAAALQVLKDIPVLATPGDIARARELASHYRWRAKIRNQRVYGEKQEVTVVTPASALSDADLEAELQRLLAKVNQAEPRLQ